MSPTITAAPGAAPSQESPATRGRLLLGGAVVLIVVLVAAGIALLRSGSSTVPYVDARSSGTLTLCGADGRPVTSGSTNDKPFVTRVVGATAATGEIAGNGRTATLYAFQPRNGAESEEWSGQLLTAGSSYTNAAHPMAQATSADIALNDFLIAFPPRWNGFIQLRLYLASPASGVAAKYDTADLQITGDRWKVVGKPGLDHSGASCTDGDATSNESRGTS